MNAVDERQSDPRLTVEWAPAYELLLSVTAFAARKLHPNLELGQGWVRELRQRLPSDFEAPNFGKHDCDCLPLLLVHLNPALGDAASFIDWLSALSPGAMYDALCEHLPHDTSMPRDFHPWRDRMLAGLRVWNERYFSTLDPAILDGLRSNAESLQARVGSVPPLELVEQATNGLWWEPEPELRHILLVPQYHQRPYNGETNLRDGVIVFYPADVLPAPLDSPPTGLLRLTRGLGDESRLRILRFLAHGPCTLTDVARFAGLSQPTVHHHLTQLRVAGLVRIHCSLSGPSRYSLRPHAVDDLAHQLGSYLEPEKGEPG
jgi:DNA-binding transcriptional ArsR family regulator